MSGSSDFKQSADFDKAVKDSKALDQSKLSNDQKLAIYSHYKQTTVGDCNIDRPGMLDVKGKAKWDAWNGLKGTTRDDAQKKYIELVNA